MVKINCSRIILDTESDLDEEDVIIELPDSVDIEIEEEEGYSLEELVDNYAADILSDRFGFCVNCFSWEKAY